MTLRFQRAGSRAPVMKRHFETRLATEEEDDMRMTAAEADTWLRDGVMQELAWDPAFDATGSAS